MDSENLFIGTVGAVVMIFIIACAVNICLDGERRLDCVRVSGDPAKCKELFRD